MSKWERVDPNDIKVGDRVRFRVRDSHGDVSSGEFTVRAHDEVENVLYSTTRSHYYGHNDFAWYRRKPKKAKEPERPVEPTEAGTFVRVKRTGALWQKRVLGLWRIVGGGISQDWERVTEPGDEIEILKLVPAKPETVTTEAEYEALPEGSIVAETGFPAWILDNDRKQWLHPSAAKYRHEHMAGTTREVLRYGWGE